MFLHPGVSAPHHFLPQSHCAAAIGFSPAPEIRREGGVSGAGATRQKPQRAMAALGDTGLAVKPSRLIVSEKILKSSIYFPQVSFKVGERDYKPGNQQTAIFTSILVDHF